MAPRYDKHATLSDDQAVTTTDYSTGSYDLWNGNTSAPTIPGYGTATPTNDPGRGVDVEIEAQVTEAFANGTSIVCAVITSANENLTSETVLHQTAAIATATLIAGYKFRLGTIPVGVAQRYLGLKYTVVGTMNAGKITAGIVSCKQTNPTV